jgi:(p)ppGpp synthase/HD superfamily hydrolase
MSIVSTALVFAAEHHQHQFRKGSRIPYMSHLLNVCRILAENDCEEELLAAALLHDIIEDTDVTIEEVESRFGQRVAELVSGATEQQMLQKDNSDKTSTWEQRKEHTISFLREEATTDQLLVSFADKLDNLRAIAADYQRIGDQLWQRFNRSKAQQAWYYGSLAQVMQEKAGLHPLIAAFSDEFTRLHSEAFGT